MTNEITTQELNKQEITNYFKDLNYKLPEQVIHHFKDASIEKLKDIAIAYSGNKKEPTFQEWIESYQQGEFLKKTIMFEERGKQLQEQIKQKEEEIKNATGEEENKKLKAEIKRLNSLSNNNEEYLILIHEKLNKFVTQQLNREAPKQLEVTHKKITPGDVAQLLHQARIEEAEFKDIKE